MTLTGVDVTLTGVDATLIDDEVAFKAVEVIFTIDGEGDGATHAEVEECLDHAHTSPITLLHALLGPVYATLHKEPVKPTLHMHVPVFVQI